MTRILAMGLMHGLRQMPDLARLEVWGLIVGIEPRPKKWTEMTVLASGVRFGNALKNGLWWLIVSLVGASIIWVTTRCRGKWFCTETAENMASTKSFLFFLTRLHATCLNSTHSQPQPPRNSWWSKRNLSSRPFESTTGSIFLSRCIFMHILRIYQINVFFTYF